MLRGISNNVILPDFLMLNIMQIAMIQSAFIINVIMLSVGAYIVVLVRNAVYQYEECHYTKSFGTKIRTMVIRIKDSKRVSQGMAW